MTVVRTALAISVLTLAAKALGIARQGIFAHTFGVGREIDIYVAAFRLPDLILNLLIMGTLSAAFIPVFVQLLQKNRSAAFETASSIFNFTLFLVGVFAIGAYFLSPWLVPMIVPGFDSVETARTLELAKILLLSPIFFALSAVLTGVLHSHKRFFLAATAPLFYNLAIIAGVYILYPRLGLPGLAWGAVVGSVLHFVIQLPTVWRLGLRPLAKISFTEPVKKIVKLFLPRVFGLDLGQISMFATAVIGSSLATGSLAVFYYAYDLQIAPFGLLVVPFAVAAFPTMSEYLSKNDLRGFKDFFSTSVVQVLFLIIPVSVFLLLLRAQIVRLILGAGEDTRFDFAATKLTAQALGFFALSLFAQSLIPFLARSFYALQNTVIPVLAGLIGGAVNIVLAILFTKVAGPDTLALAFSIAVVINMLILLFVLHYKLGGLNDEFLILRTVKIATASVIMAVAVYITLYTVAPLVDMQTYAGVLAQTMAAVVAAVLTYVLAGLFIGLPETGQLLRVMQMWFKKVLRGLTSPEKPLE